MENFVTTEQFYAILCLKIILGISFVYLMYRFAKRTPTDFDTPYRKRMRMVYGILFSVFAIGFLVLAFTSPLASARPWYNYATYGTFTPSELELQYGFSEHMIVRPTDAVCIWGRQTFEQSSMGNNIAIAIACVALAVYFFTMKRSSVKWHSKVRKFIGYALLLNSYTLVNTLHYFDSYEIIPIAVYALIIYLLLREYKWDHKQPQKPLESQYEHLEDFNAEHPEEIIPVANDSDDEKNEDSSSDTPKQKKRTSRPNKYLQRMLLSAAIIIAVVSTHYFIYYSSNKYYWLQDKEGWARYSTCVIPEYGVAFSTRHQERGGRVHLVEESGFEDPNFGKKIFSLVDIYNPHDYIYFDYYQSCHVIGYKPNGLFEDNETYLLLQKARIEKELNVDIALGTWELYTSRQDSLKVNALWYLQEFHMDTKDERYYRKKDGSYERLKQLSRLYCIFCYDNYVYEVVSTSPEGDACTDFKYEDLIVSRELKQMYSSVKKYMWIAGIISFGLYLFIIISLILMLEGLKDTVVNNGVKNESAFLTYSWILNCVGIECVLPIVSVIPTFIDDDLQTVLPVCIVYMVVVSIIYKYFILRYLRYKRARVYTNDYLIPEWYKNRFITPYRNQETWTKISLVLLFYPLFYIATLPCGILAFIYLIPMAAIFGLIFFIRWLFKDYTPSVSLPEPKKAPQSVATDNSSKTKLQLLKSMLDEGLITQEDYDKKKGEILKKM